MRRALAFCLLWLTAAANAAPQTPGVAAFDYGYFCALDPVEEQASPDTVSGTVQLVADLPTFIARDLNVPAQVGVGFGVHVQTLPQFAGQVTVTSEHPPMGPNGVTRQSWVTDLSATEQNYVGYSFEYDYELLPGLWTLSAQANGRMLYSITFNILPPTQSPGVPCRQNIPLS